MKNRADPIAGENRASYDAVHLKTTPFVQVPIFFEMYCKEFPKKICQTSWSNYKTVKV
jgi:hypothetical protein